MKFIKQILLVVFLLCGVVFSQSTSFQDSLLDRMTGEWVLAGTIDGQQTTHDVSVSWILQHQYLQIKEISREKDSTGKALYEALVLICKDDKLHQYSCLWLDVTAGGGLKNDVFGHAERKGDSIPFLFNIGGSLFHTTFAYQASSDSWQWTMDGEVNGTLQPFARLKMTRKE
jgi:hypothetical protein